MTPLPVLFHRNMDIRRCMRVIVKMDNRMMREYSRLRRIPRTDVSDIDLLRHKRTVRLESAYRAQYFSVRPRTQRFIDMIMAHRKREKVIRAVTA